MWQVDCEWLLNGDDVQDVDTVDTTEGQPIGCPSVYLFIEQLFILLSELVLLLRCPRIGYWDFRCI